MFQLIQRADLHLLIGARAATDHRHRRIGSAAVGDQALADVRRLHGAHVDSQRLPRPGQIGPVQAIAVRGGSGR